MRISSYHSTIETQPEFSTEVKIQFILQTNHIVNREHEIESFLSFLKYSLYNHYQLFYTKAISITRAKLIEHTHNSYQLDISIPYNTQNVTINLKPIAGYHGKSTRKTQNLQET